MGPLHRDKGDTRDFLHSIASAHVKGMDLNWNAIYPNAHKIELPTYALQREKYWLPAIKNKKLSQSNTEEFIHPFIGSKLELHDGSYIYSGKISLEEFSWLADHKVFKKIIIPATV